MGFVVVVCFLFLLPPNSPLFPMIQVLHQNIHVHIHAHACICTCENTLSFSFSESAEWVISHLIPEIGHLWPW